MSETLKQPLLPITGDNYAVLNNLGVIKLTGKDRETYLQGQVTCDVINATINNWQFGAHCDAKGKTFSVFRMVKTDDQILLITTKDAAEQSLEQLKKFAVFSNVELSLEPMHAIYVLGTENLYKQLLGESFTADDKAIINGHFGIGLCLGKDWLFLSNNNDLEKKLESTECEQLAQDIWSYSEIHKGIPQIHQASVGQFVPQMLNVQAIDGISFTKGCYIGQETVARMQYLGKNKRALFALHGNSSATINIGDIVETQSGESWRRAGQVMDLHQSDNGATLIQLVLASDTDANARFKLKDSEEAAFSIYPLPYNINELG